MGPVEESVNLPFKSPTNLASTEPVIGSAYVTVDPYEKPEIEADVY
jgi:hypothetical protein